MNATHFDTHASDGAARARQFDSSRNVALSAPLVVTLALLGAAGAGAHVRPPPGSAAPPAPATPAPAPAVVIEEQPARAPSAPAEQEARSERAALRLAVRDIEVGDESDRRLAEIVTQALTEELRKLQRTSVIAQDEIRAMLDMEAEKQLAGCAADESCIAEIVEALGADALVIGSIARVGTDERLFALKIIDQKTARTSAQITQRLTIASGEECLAMIGPAVAKLFPSTPLRPGAARGVAPELALRLNPPPLSPWVFWSGAAATTAALATGVAATVVNASAHGAAQSLVDGASETSKAPGDALEREVSSVRNSFAVLVVGYTAAVALGAATGVTALFTDWQGLGAE